MKRKPRVLALFDAAQPLPLDHDFTAELNDQEWKTEADVVGALRTLGCPHELLAIHDDTDLIRQKLQSFRPDVVFNLVEEFKRKSAFEQNITSFLELQGVPFTGCGSTGMTLCKNKSIAKKVLGYHRIRVPEFVVLAPGRPIVRPRRLRFPIFVKPLKTESSTGIAQASFVENDEQFKQRVAFIHDKFNQEAIAEEYIDGRELYVSILGNHRLQVFPVREIVFKEVPPEEPKFASYKAKWDEEYRKRWGIGNEFAAALDPAVVRRIEQLGKRIYRLLAIDGYARLDLRLTPGGDLVFIEANPNPAIGAEEDFAQSALKAGLTYPGLIERILRLGLTAERG